MSGPILTAHGLALPGRLHSTNLTLETGSLTLLVGPNGAGKTSLLHRLAGIGEGRGTSLIDGVALTEMPPALRIGRIGFLSANREIAWPLVVRDLVALGLGSRQDADAVDRTLVSLDAGQFADRRMDQLSSGERARIMLARALVASPDVLLLDEPAAHLDPVRQIALLERLRQEAARGAAVLASLHDLALARSFGDRVIVMADGRVMADGDPQKALDARLVADVFNIRWEDGAGWVRAR